MPVAVTEKEAVCPAVTSTLTGCVVIDGATALPPPDGPPVPPIMFKVAVLLVTLPALLLTVTVNNARSSDAVVGGVVYDAAFAPLIALPFFCHW